MLDLTWFFSFFVEFEYHGFAYKQQCAENCSGLLSGLPTVSQLEYFSEMIAGEEDLTELCELNQTFFGPNKNRKKGSCVIFLDADYEWKSRTWKSKNRKIDDSLWLHKSNRIEIVPKMPLMSEFLLGSLLTCF